MNALLLELAGVAARALRAGVREYKANPTATTQAMISIVILKEIGDWKPTVSGKCILTPGLKTSLASALAGLAHNIAAAEAGRGLV